MNAKVRRKLEMGIRALEFSRAHLDSSAGYAAALGRLEDNVRRAQALAAQQRTGVIAARSGTARKQELRAVLKQSLLKHVARVAGAASKEVPELVRKFQLPRENTSYQTFRTAARTMADEAQVQKDLLVRHGLSEPLLVAMGQLLDEFDEAVEQCNAGKRAHVGARAELDALLEETVQVVLVLDGLNRYRFANDAEQLAAWLSATNVLSPIHSNGEKPAPPEVGSR